MVTNAARAADAARTARAAGQMAEQREASGSGKECSDAIWSGYEIGPLDAPRGHMTLSRSREAPDDVSATAMIRLSGTGGLTAAREAKMVLIPVVLVVGGLLGLVYWLEKRASPWPN
jgi:hypothetical protein